jgi:predicted nucleotidyltransferase
MDVSKPYGVIAHPLDSAVLHVLTGANSGLTGRRIARLAKEGTQQGVAKALNRLSEEGIVDREAAGNAILFKLNREHLAADSIEQLMRLREELVKRLAMELSDWAIKPVHASMYGSAARSDGDARSDIDLFIVRPRGVKAESMEWQDQLERLAARVEAWTGNRAGVVDVSEDDLATLRRRRQAIVGELERDALQLMGQDVSVVLAGVD